MDYVGIKSCSEKGYMMTRVAAGKLTTQSQRTTKINDDVIYVTGILRNVLIYASSYLITYSICIDTGFFDNVPVFNGFFLDFCTRFLCFFFGLLFLCL